MVSWTVIAIVFGMTIYYIVDRICECKESKNEKECGEEERD